MSNDNIAASVNTEVAKEIKSLPPRQRSLATAIPRPDTGPPVAVEANPAVDEANDLVLELSCRVFTKSKTISDYRTQQVTIPGGADPEKSMASLKCVNQQLQFVVHQVTIDMKRWRDSILPKNETTHPDAMNQIGFNQSELEAKYIAAPIEKATSDAEIHVIPDDLQSH